MHLNKTISEADKLISNGNSVDNADFYKNYEETKKAIGERNA